MAITFLHSDRCTQTLAFSVRNMQRMKAQDTVSNILVVCRCSWVRLVVISLLETISFLVFAISGNLFKKKTMKTICMGICMSYIFSRCKVFVYICLSTAHSTGQRVNVTTYSKRGIVTHTQIEKEKASQRKSYLINSTQNVQLQGKHYGN